MSIGFIVAAHLLTIQKWKHIPIGI
ncbi:hypothetical protein CCP3SC15_160011 [Gammaproteobacteria bacterium]